MRNYQSGKVAIPNSVDKYPTRCAPAAAGKVQQPPRASATADFLLLPTPCGGVRGRRRGAEVGLFSTESAFGGRKYACRSTFAQIW
eukprot:2436242-Pleurochrysis_carterae.AAC.1